MENNIKREKTFFKIFLFNPNPPVHTPWRFRASKMAIFNENLTYLANTSLINTVLAFYSVLWYYLTLLRYKRWLEKNILFYKQKSDIWVSLYSIVYIYIGSLILSRVSNKNILRKTNIVSFIFYKPLFIFY